MTHPGPGRSHHDDPYRVLGVDAGASRQDIARAYRRAVHGAHPDAQPADPQAAARFQALTDAYDLLSDPARRAGYDRTRPPAGEPGGQMAQKPQSRRHGPGGRWPGPLHLVWPPGGQPLWAGPVQIEPPSGTASPPGAGVEDPPVILGTWPGRHWSWLW